MALSRLRLESSRIEVSPQELTEARRVRDALWRLAVDRAHGRPARLADHAVLNRAAAEAPMVPQINADGRGGWAVPVSGAQLTSTIARDAIELFTGPLAQRMRECAAEDCYLIFVDTSRPGRRRWCAMERCGNRHKVRALRARRETEPEAPQP
jgi:predicted RNA-binding Zn ribbon-like protein